MSRRFQAVTASNGPLEFVEAELDQQFNRADRDRRTKIQRDIDGFKAASPFAPARAMVVVDLPQPMEPVVFVRGKSRQSWREGSSSRAGYHRPLRFGIHKTAPVGWN